MAIILIILGSIGWIADINQWFIVPSVLYKGALVLGTVWIVLSMIYNIITRNKINKFF